MGLDGTAGTLILVGFAYGVNEWRMLILAVTSPLILSVIAWWYLTFTFCSFFCYKQLDFVEATGTVTENDHILVSCIRWLPESARWLQANGKADEAYEYIKKCAMVNGRGNELELKPEVHFNNPCIFVSCVLNHNMQQ